MKSMFMLYDIPAYIFVEGFIQVIRGNTDKAKEIFGNKDDLSLDKLEGINDLFGKYSNIDELNLDLYNWLNGTKLEHSFENCLNINHLFERYFLETCIENPMELTNNALLDGVGFKNHNRYLNDNSNEHKLKKIQVCKNTLNDLRKFKIESLSEEVLVSRNIMEFELTNAINKEPFILNNYEFDQMDGIQFYIQLCMNDMHGLETLDDIKNYVLRLKKISDMFHKSLNNMKESEKNKVYPPKFMAEYVIDSMTKFINDTDGSFVNRIKNQLNSDRLSESDKLVVETLLEEGKNVMKESVYPAYQKVIDYFKDLLENNTITENKGVKSLPNGQDYYKWLISNHTTTNLTPEEIHEIGLKEVKNIQEQMRLLLKLEGYDTENKSLCDLVQGVCKESRFLYEDTIEGKNELLTDYVKLISELEPKLDQIFDLKPSKSCIVKAIPSDQENGAPYAYYMYPASDGSRPGIFYVNLGNINNTPKLAMMTLTLHEAIPGHHFQLSLALENKNVPIFRRFYSGYNAYVEGWALYCERLGTEYGYYKTNFDLLGNLRDDIMRGIRLVVDTGIHHFDWTREQAIEYMETNSGMTHEATVIEIQRYFVLPGQALSYKLGQLKILELRQKMKDKLGDKYSIKEFHNLVLGVGGCPLNILEEYVLN